MAVAVESRCGVLVVACSLCVPVLRACSPLGGVYLNRKAQIIFSILNFGPCFWALDLLDDCETCQSCLFFYQDSNGVIFKA